MQGSRNPREKVAGNEKLRSPTPFQIKVTFYFQDDLKKEYLFIIQSSGLSCLKPNKH